MFRVLVVAGLLTVPFSLAAKAEKPCPTCLPANDAAVVENDEANQAQWVELFWGATVEPSGEASDKFRGMVVTEVVQGGAIDSAGVEPGMVILEVNGQPVTNVFELKFAISTVKSAKAFLAIRHKSKTFFKSVRNTDHEGW